MKKKFFLITAILTMGLAVGAFIASCSSDSDEPTYENNAQRIEAMKAKVLKMAEMYGLEVSFEEGFEQQCLQEHFLDSLEVDFMRISQLKGYYTLITTEGNKLSFDSGREKLLKQRRSTVGEREYNNYSGSFSMNHEYRDKVNNDIMTITYTLEWNYTNENLGDVELRELSVSDSRYEVDTMEPVHYQFIGSIPNFTYSLRVKINKKNVSVYNYITITGVFNNGVPFEDSQYGSNSKHNNICLYNNVTIK